MRHRVAGRKLGRTTAHRQALLRNLSTALFDKERIRTTLAKAKELRPFAERLVTLCRRDSLHARRRVMRHIHDRKVVAKLFDTISPRYAQRPGGYTRIVKLGPRRGDHAEMAIIELVSTETAADETESKPAKKATKKKAAAPTRKKTTKKKASAKATAKKKAPKTAKKKSTRKKAAGKSTKD